MVPEVFASLWLHCFGLFIATSLLLSGLSLDHLGLWTQFGMSGVFRLAALTLLACRGSCLDALSACQCFCLDALTFVGMSGLTPGCFVGMLGFMPECLTFCWHFRANAWMPCWHVGAYA